MRPSEVYSHNDPTPGETEAGIGLLIDESGSHGEFQESRGVTRIELALVVLLGLALLIPGIWRYSLVDPWETHYSEVSRRMLQDHDLVRTQWQNEGFRSKPVLTFWMIAASLRANGLARDGGFSGEMVSTKAILFAVRLPFVLWGVFGLVCLWWMLTRLVKRRVAWLAFLIVGTSPFYFFVARQAITDMPAIGCIIGAISCFALAVHAGEAPLRPLLGRRRPWNSLHVHLAALVAFVGWQIVYYAYHFAVSGHRAVPVVAPHVVLPLAMLVLLAGFIFWAVYVQPVRQARQVYMFWFYTLVFVGVLAKGLLPVALIGLVCFFYIVLTRDWRLLRYIELPRALLLFALIVLPWHIGMWIEEGPIFVREWVIGHNWNRFFSDKMHGDRGTFNYFMEQIGVGMWPWVALLPAAVASVLTKTSGTTRTGRVRLIAGIWAIVAMWFFASGRTKFHHYILPAIPAFGVLVALWIDDLLAGRVRRVGVTVVAAMAIALLIMRDVMHEQSLFIEMFVYRYDRPWPSDAPWSVDLSDALLAFGLVFTALLALFAVRRVRKLALAGLAVATISFAYWGMNVYMLYAGEHWGQRTAIAMYYNERQIHGMDIWYYSARQITDEWDGFKGPFVMDTVVPEHLSPGQPMKIKVALMNSGNQTEREATMLGQVARIGEHRIFVDIPEAELARVQPLIELGRKLPRGRKLPWRMVNADRLIAWQLYWRGENFWTGDEIWARDPDAKTAYKETDNKDFLKYLDGEGRKGRRYYLVTEAGRAHGLAAILPTARAKDTFQILDRSSNKFTLVTFVL